MTSLHYVLKDAVLLGELAIGESSTIADALGSVGPAPLACGGVGVKGDSVTLCINLVKSSMRKHLVIGVCLWQRAPSDYRSDTHWHRSSVDQFLWRHAVEHGVVDLTGHAVVGIEVSLSGPVKVVCESADPDTRGSSRFEIESDWLIDASGSACVVSRYLPVDKKTEQLRTSTHACFGHFHQVKNWTDIVDPAQRADFENPFSADDAAQHHLIDHGWMWMLRFNQGVTSVGYTTLSHQPLPELESLKSRYPSIKAMLSEAEIVAPAEVGFKLLGCSVGSRPSRIQGASCYRQQR